MMININTTRFPSEISFRSDCINNFDTSHSRLNNGIRSCCSFWSSLMCSLHNTTQVYTHYTVQTTHTIPCTPVESAHTIQGISQPEGPEMSISGKKSSFFLLVYWRRPDTCPDVLIAFFG